MGIGNMAGDAGESFGLGGLGSLIGARRHGTVIKQGLRDFNQALDQYGGLDEHEGMSQLEAGPSQASRSYADPRAIAAQHAALQRLQSMMKGGMSADDQAAYYANSMQQQQQAKGNRDAIMSQAARTGRLSSGQALSAQLAAQQAAQDNIALRGNQLAGDAAARARGAAADAGGLASGMRQGSYQEAFGRGSAADQMAQYNAEARNKMFANALALAGQRADLLQNRAAFRAGQSVQQRAMHAKGRDESAQMASSILGMGGKMTGGI